MNVEVEIEIGKVAKDFRRNKRVVCSSIYDLEIAVGQDLFAGVQTGYLRACWVSGASQRLDDVGQSAGDQERQGGSQVREPFDAKAHVAHMEKVMGLCIQEAWRPAVEAHTAATAKAAGLVQDFPLEDEVEVAPVFVP